MREAVDNASTGIKATTFTSACGDRRPLFETPVSKMSGGILNQLAMLQLRAPTNCTKLN
jgi:hypothetical protein